MKTLELRTRFCNILPSISLLTSCSLAAAYILASCSDMSPNESVSGPKPVSVTVEAYINADASHTNTDLYPEQHPATKTFIENETEGIVSWNPAGETLKVIESYDAASGEHQAVNTDGFALDGLKAKFSLSIAPAAGKEQYYYTAIYPTTAYNPAANSIAGSFRLTLPAEQTAGKDSFDPAADLMRSNAVSTDLTEDPSLSFTFTRIVSINKMILKGLTAGENVSEVVIESSKALAGNCVINLTGAYIKTSTAAEKTLTVKMPYAAVSEDGELPVWFTSYPASFGEGDSMKITVSTTEECVYEKTIAFSADKTLEFKSGSGTKFSVSGWTKTLPALDFTTAEAIEAFKIPANADQTSDETTVTAGEHGFTIAGRYLSDANQITYYAHNNTSAKLYSLYFTKKGSVGTDYQYGIIGLPKVAGYAPASLSIVGYNTAAKEFRVCDVARTVPAAENTVGTLTIPAKTGTACTMELDGTSADKNYYLWIPLWVQFRQLTVSYK